MGLKLLRGLQLAVQRTSQTFAVLAAVVILVLLVLTVADVLMRNIVGRAAPGVFEYSEVALVAIVFLGIPYTMQVGGHVAMDSVTKRLPEAVAKWAEFMGLFLALPVVAWLAMSSARVALQSFRISEVRAGIVQVPIWPARAFVPMAAVLLAAEMIILMVRIARDETASGDDAVDARLGP